MGCNNTNNSTGDNSCSSQATCGNCNDANCSGNKRGEDENDDAFRQRQKLQSSLCAIKHKIVVLSGKGGVGKSTVATNLAVSLAHAGKRVGLLDVDIHGPSIPTMLGVENMKVCGKEGSLLPVEINGIKVMSVGFILENQNDAVIWRGPLKMGVIKQFLSDVSWGELDYLIIDCPPGTGDEPLSICQLIQKLDGAVVVTTPQRVAAVDVKKSITFCHQLNLPVLGVIENMSGFTCPKCGEVSPIFLSGGGKAIAEEMKVPFLGAIPIDLKIGDACDQGLIYAQHKSDSPIAIILKELIGKVENSN